MRMNHEPAWLRTTSLFLGIGFLLTGHLTCQIHFIEDLTKRRVPSLSKSSEEPIKGLVKTAK
jgi:hypothetical protein